MTDSSVLPLVSPNVFKRTSALLVPCIRLGCYGSMHNEGGKSFFRHDYNDKTDFIEIKDSQIKDVDLDIWGTIVAPWINRLHEDFE